MFRSGKYNLKIRGGMHVPLLNYFSSECLSDLLDNRVGKEGGREEASGRGGREREEESNQVREREGGGKNEREQHSGKDVPLHNGLKNLKCVICGTCLPLLPWSKKIL